MTYRVGILGIQHESNTFLAGKTTLDDFRSDIYAEGEAVIEKMRSAHHEVGGFIEALSAADVEIVPILFTRALPSSVIERSTATALSERAIKLLRDAGRLDGLLVAPHGAAVSEISADFDGYWLSLVRNAVGAFFPIVCTIDPHANLSAAMVNACNAITAYRTNPHIDQRDRGIEAATLLLKHLRGEAKLTAAASMPRIVINIERQRTSVEPCAALYRKCNELMARPGVLSASVVLGFPYADVAEMGSAFIVVCDGNHQQASAFADELGRFLIDRRDDYVGRLIDIDTALTIAEKNTAMSVLLDIGDNVGGGGPGTSTAVVGALLRRGLGPAVATLFDAAAVRQAVKTGIGNQIESVVGAVDPHTGKPLTFTAHVKGIYDGRFTESKPRHGGATHFDMGQTAVLETASLTLIITSRRLFPTSLEQYRACGLDIHQFRYVVAKGVHAPIAAYEPLGASFIHVNTPGVTSADLSQFTFTARRKPLFPFEPIEQT